MFTPSQKRKGRKQINIVQGSAANGGFKRGYQSFVSDSRTPFDALSDMTNVTLDQDNLPRPRQSLVLFGGQPLGAMLGVGTFIKIVSGQPEKWDISMQVIGGYGKIHTRKDGGTWVAAGGTNQYSSTAMVNFCQSGNRVYASNGINNMSYYDIATNATIEYNALSTPSTPTATGTGLTGTTFTYYYRVSANSAVGESAASVADTEQVALARDQWTTGKYITITWSAVAGAVTSYNVYVGTVAGEEKYLTTVSNGLTFVDDGTMVANAFKVAPAGNSTAGPKLTYMWNKDSQLFGVGDADNPDYLWYDAGATATGDFSPFNGGGNVSINAGGDTVPTAVRSFRTGKGDAALTVLSSGVAGVGKMHHVVFTTSTFDNNVINIPNVSEANGQGGTIAPRAVVEVNNSIVYLTGQDFKSTGTSPNIQNILSTNSISADIIPDVRMINRNAARNACALVYENKAYFALPVGSPTNNQIWVKDYSRKGIWIMPWTIAAKFMWLSEDNTTGEISFCIYNGTNILKFSSSVMTQDNGVPFRTRVAHEGLVFSDDGMSMGAIQNQRFKFLQPVGEVKAEAFGLDEDGAVNTLASEVYTQTSSFTGWNQWMYSDGNEWSGDVGEVNYTAKQVSVIPLEIDETLNQLGWQVTTEKAGCDYSLSAVLTTGVLITSSYYGD